MFRANGKGHQVIVCHGLRDPQTFSGLVSHSLLTPLVMKVISSMVDSLSYSPHFLQHRGPVPNSCREGK